MPALDAHRFRYDAMATTFEVVIAQGDIELAYARQAADAVHQEIARLEDELSRFRQTSDIWRISQLQAGESTRVGLAAFDCLALSKAVYEETHGAFDITMAPLLRLWRQNDGTPRQPHERELEDARAIVGSQHFSLNEETLTVTVHASQMVFDLGGVGKGYALDQSLHILEDWGIKNALLNAGDSTLLAIGKAPNEIGWPVSLSEGADAIVLCDQAVSGSGFQVQGAHIIDPRTHAPVPPRPERTFAIAPTAALSDALSTAFAILGQDEVDAICQRNPGVETRHC